jgi:YVTN family beta-propeller protein
MGTLLTYDILPSPTPLVVTPAGGAVSYGTLSFTVTNSGNELVDCTSITLSMLVGFNAKDLTSDPTGIESFVPNGWSATPTGGSFFISPLAGVGLIGGKSLTFTLSGIKINGQAGQTDITITEVAAPHHGEPVTSTTTISLDKSTLIVPAITYSGLVNDEQLTLGWTTENAEYCTLSGSDTLLPPSQTTQAFVPQLSTYVLTAYGSADVAVTSAQTRALQWGAVGEQHQLEMQTSAIAASPDGTRLYSVTYTNGPLNNFLVARDSQTWNITHQQTTPQSAWGLLVSPDGQRIYVFLEEGVASYDAALDLIACVYGMPSLFVGAVSPDGTMLCVGGPNAPHLQVLDATTLAPLATPDLGGQPGAIVFSPDSQTIYATGGGDQSLRAFNAMTGAQVGVVPSCPNGIAISADGSLLYVANWEDSTVSVIDASSMTVLDVVSVSASPDSLGLSADGLRLFVFEGRVMLEVVDTTFLRVLQTLPIAGQALPTGEYAKGGGYSAASNRWYSLLASSQETGSKAFVNVIGVTGVTP